MHPLDCLGTWPPPLFLAALLLIAPAASPAREVADGAAVQQSISHPDVRAAAERLSIAAGRSTDALAAELERASMLGAGGEIAREWLLDQGLHTLASMTPTPAARAFVIAAAQRPPQVFVRVDPDHGSHLVPLYDPAATAGFVLRAWERRTARERATADLLSYGGWSVARFAQDARSFELDPVKAGIADAFRTVPIDALTQQRAAIDASLDAGANAGELALIAAERLGDPQLYDLVLQHADASTALRGVRSARAGLGESAALKLLTAAAQRDEIASASILEIGRIAPTDAAARALLFDMLDEGPAGPSAAAALSKLRDDSVVAELGRRLNSTASNAARTNAALALKLDGSAPARAELEKFLQTTHGTAALRKDVRAWLAQ